MRIPVVRRTIWNGSNEIVRVYPLILRRKTDELKSRYLIDPCKELYLKDIKDRHNLHGDNVMADMVSILASAVGSLTNPTKLANTFSTNGIHVSDKTIGT